MKKTLLKVLSSTLALTLVATASVATATVKEIPVQEIKARPAAVETVKEEVRENSVLAAVEAKIREEKAAEVKEVKAAPMAKLAAEEAPVKVVKEAAAPVAEAAVAPEVHEEAEPEMVWDISATEFDNVAMAFYAEPAAVNQVDARDNGLVVISGEGAMEDAVYRHFITVEKYLSAVKAMFEDHYGVEVDLVYDEEITDVIALDEGIRYYAHETGEELGVTEEMRQGLAPDTFLAYSPKTIVIEEGITNISDYAFVCCSEVETIVLPSTIETIGESAFEHCDSLQSIVLPENAKIDETAFAYCDSLATVQLANADYYLGGGLATSADGENSNVRALSAAEVNALVHYWS
ncbi:MAG: leucine-rich repeat domain-containing protein [Oscillospiraceae bacterium]|nr:leucine-rich repeat domain-containing protein [Oscillospiraceae bacterium]